MKESSGSTAERDRAFRSIRVLNLGDRQVVTHGLPRRFVGDIYHYAMTVRWLPFFCIIGTLFLLINALFACLFVLGDGAVANQSPSGFLGAFFFSVETLATVGYGDMHPQTLYGHVVATIEIFTGMSCIALMTGVMFARFSRPRARILFARNPVIGPIDGKTTLMIRAANARQNVIVDASARLRLLRSEVSPEGIPIRKLYDLKLVREQHPIFLLGWTIMHVIDSNSPLNGETPESLASRDAALILTVDGVDETTSQTMQSRAQYSHRMLRWNHHYVDLLWHGSDGMDHMDYTLFHDVRPVADRTVDPDAEDDVASQEPSTIDTQDLDA